MLGNFMVPSLPGHAIFVAGVGVVLIEICVYYFWFQRPRSLLVLVAATLLANALTTWCGYLTGFRSTLLWGAMAADTRIVPVFVLAFVGSVFVEYLILRLLNTYLHIEKLLWAVIAANVASYAMLAGVVFGDWWLNLYASPY